MEMTEKLPRPGAARTWMGVGILLMATLGSALVAHDRPPSASNVMLACTITALGIMGMASVLAAATRYPRWSHWASAVVLAGWAIASPWIAGSPEAWRSEAPASLWMLPWFLMTMTSVGGSARGLCATHGRRAGWIQVGASFGVGAILSLAGMIGRVL